MGGSGSHPTPPPPPLPLLLKVRLNASMLLPRCSRLRLNRVQLDESSGEKVLKEPHPVVRAISAPA